MLVGYMAVRIDAGSRDDCGVSQVMQAMGEKACVRVKAGGRMEVIFPD